LEPRPVLAVDEIQLSELDFWERPLEEREGAFATLRAERPISFHEEIELEGLPRGEGYWAITRHADILEVSRTPEVFCSGGGITVQDLPQPMVEFFSSMIAMDEPRHGRMRRIVSRGFTPKMLRRLEQYVQRSAAEVVDSVLDKGECDFVTEIAAPLPLHIICDMMGIPESQRAYVFERSNIILGLGDPEYTPEGSDIIQAAMGAAIDLVQVVQELGQMRRSEPTEDLTSMLVNAELDGEQLSDQELGSFFILLVVAGNETTRNAISHGMKALCDYPDQRARWVADFEGLAQPAVEEIVRWSSPVLYMRRTATRDTELSGQKILEGEKLALFYCSGNRDEDVFSDPFVFDVGRSPNEHIGFGGPGPHFCMGAHLARREIRVMFRELFTRLPDLEITGPPDRLLSNFVHGIKRMPCAFTPGGKRAA
jgi:cytochrome P450